MRNFLFVFLLFFSLAAYAQTDSTSSLLDLLGDEKEIEYTKNAFKSPRVVNGHSMEMLGAGLLDFRILHRFGRLDQGVQDLFGLDNATMRMGFDYGVSENLTVGIGRSTSKKEYDGYVKYRILWQSTGKREMPVSVIWVSGLTINTLTSPLSQADVAVTLSRRMGYYHQIIIGRKFSNKLTLQLTPTLVHTNIVNSELHPNDLWALGFGGRYKFSQRVAFVWDYFYAFNRFPNQIAENPLSIGFDIDTGGHIFQLHLSNSVGMNERAFISDQNTSWFRGEIRFGFNLSRVFQIKKKKA
jgi:Membrane bound beta barrel domain (DUF5777)